MLSTLVAERVSEPNITPLITLVPINSPLRW